MANNKIDMSRCNEIEIFDAGGQHEAGESQYRWEHCKKNPGHKKFMSAQEFKDTYLPKVHDVGDREWFRSYIDLAVRLRVSYTSRERPDDDQFSQVRGRFNLRSGTGFIRNVSPPQINKPCPCGDCGGKQTKKHWRFEVRTAHHVVYNTEEAEKTKVDLFLDDESCEGDGRMKSVGGVWVDRCLSDRDGCGVMCVTCDEDLGERIESAYRCYSEHTIKERDLSGLDLLDSDSDRGCDSLLVASHPHGQPKKISWGLVREDQEDDLRLSYTVPTCPGSSGATVFRFRHNTNLLMALDLLFSPVHSGSCLNDGGEQINYAFWYF